MKILLTLKTWVILFFLYYIAHTKNIWSSDKGEEVFLGVIIVMYTIYTIALTCVMVAAETDC